MSILKNKKSIETNGFIFHDNGNHNNIRLVEKIKTSTVEFFHSIQSFIQSTKKEDSNNNNNNNNNNCSNNNNNCNNNNNNSEINRSKSEEVINQYIQNHFNPPQQSQPKKRNILFIFQNLKSSKSTNNLHNINNSNSNSNNSTPNLSPRSNCSASQSTPSSPRSPRSFYSTSPSSPRDYLNNNIYNSYNSSSSSSSNNNSQFDITFNMVVEKERVILTVKVPEVGLTKKILFDKVETIKDAILLIIEKLPPGCLDASEYNLYLPQKGQWCKIDSRFSKYQFKENQEIEFKKDSRGGVSHMLSSVGSLLTKPYRTIYIRLPDIVTVGTLPSLSHSSSQDFPTQQSSTSSASSSLNNSSSNAFIKNDSTPIIHRRRTSSFSYDPNIHLSSLTVNNNNSNNSSNSNNNNSLQSQSSTSIQSSSASSPTTTSSKSFVIPKLNLSESTLSPSSTSSSPRESTTTSNSSSSTSTINKPTLEHKKSFLKIIGLSPRNHSSNSNSNSNNNSLNNSTNNLSKSQGGGDSAPITPRNFGTFVRDNDNNSKLEAFDFDDDNTLGEVLNKLYSKYQLIDKDLLEDYSLITKDGVWLTDKNRTIVELGLKHMEEVEFKRMSQKVKIVFLNKELVLSFNPSDTLKDINYKIIVHYLPSLMKLARSNSILGGSGGINITSSTSSASSSSSPLNRSGALDKQTFRSSLSIEPLVITDLENAQILSSTPPTNHHLLSVQNQATRSQRSYSDTSPLSFSRDFANETNHQTQNIENLINKRKNSVSNNPSASFLSGGNSSTDTISSNSSASFSLQQIRYPIPDSLLEFKDYKLHLCSKNQNPTINSKFDLLLDERRTLSSFNFWNNIRLHFKNSTKGLHSESKRSPPAVPYYLTIESETFSINHVLELEGSLLISDILKQFNRLLISNDNIKICDSLDEYGLYFDTINTGGNREGLEYGSSIYLEPYKTLSHYPMIEPLDKLLFKRTNSIFGVDPNSIESRLDPITNLQIPNILLDLKSKFIQLDGFSVEGIFKSNTYHDPSFSDIVNALKNNTLFDSNNGVDAIGIACFIKRWYMKLPKKICSLLDDETLLYASTQESTAESSLESIPQPYRSLLLWLVRFLSEVAQSAYTNKMSAKNLAIVIAPNLISISPSHNSNNNQDSNNTPTSSSVGKYTSLEKVHQVTLFLRNLIKLKLRENGFLPISSSSISISNNSSSYISITGTGSVQSSSSPISSSLISRSPSLDIIEEN